MIAPKRIDQIVTIVERAGLGTDTVAALREALPDLHFTHCMDDDVVNQTPARAATGFNLYLVEGGSGHCLGFTRDPDRATGILLAECEPESDGA